MPVKSKITTREIDKGYDEFMKSVNEMIGEPYIKIGIQSENGSEKPEGSDLTLAGIAAVNEFGTNRAGPNRDITIPERSFIRSTMDEEKNFFYQVTRGAINRIALGADIMTELNKIGVVISSAIKKKITDLRDPPNAPSTIRRKGSSNPLVDTGRMRASITHKVVFSDEEG